MEQCAIILNGDRGIVSEFEKALLEMGMRRLDAVEQNALMMESDNDTELADAKDRIVDVSSEVVTDFWGIKEDGIFSCDPTTVTAMAAAVSALLGGGGLTAIIMGVMNRHKAEGSVELDKKGNVLKITFKDMNPKQVPIVTREIIQAVRESENKENK
ncbi:MAG: hypothetical protein K6G83_06935 [Lachnospiraceae bacterium]|nr:hypothetical protein [Lachnospiraceae bacterium]